MHNIMGTVSAAYNTAMASDFRQLVSRNPFRGGARGIKGQDMTERTYLTAEQARAIHVSLLPGYRLLFMFFVLTGLRWAEASGLRVKDVCLEPATGRPYLDVKVGLKRLKGGGWMLGRLKSQAARRRLTLPASLLEPMRALLEGKRSEDLVFTSVGGKPLHHSNFCRELTRAIARATVAGHQVPDFTPHALRHTCATWLLTSGRTLYQVSKQLGHESESTTGRYYGHVLADNRDENADTLDIALGGHWLPAELDSTSVILSAADLRLPEMCLASIDAAEDRAA
jgi:integrase